AFSIGRTDENVSVPSLSVSSPAQPVRVKHATIAALNIRMVHTSLLSQLRLTARLAVLTDLREQFENCLANSIIIARTGEFLKVIHRLGVQRRGLEPVRDSNDPIAQ